METEMMGQGLTFITDPETGRSYPIPAGGSDTPPASGEGGEGTVPSGTGDEGVQSDPAPSGDESGQGFLEPYLKDIPEEHREVVSPVLEKYRQEQDANFNRRFEQLQEEARIPTTLYQALMQDPVQTLDWIADRMKEERGLDVRSQLRERWYQSQEPSGQGQEPQSEGGDDKPLTQADIDRILQEREEQRIQQERQSQWEQQQVQQQQKTVNGWIDSAAKNFSLSLDDSQGEDPLRAIIIMQANQLHESGVARGQAAIEMATEAVAKRFAPANSGNGGQTKQPVTANGGTPPPAKQINVADPKERKARMMEVLTTPAET